MRNKVNVCIMQNCVVAAYRYDKVLHKVMLDRFNSTEIVYRDVIYRGKFPRLELDCNKSVRCDYNGREVVADITRIAYGVDGIYYVWLSDYVDEQHPRSMANYKKLEEMVGIDEVQGG